MEHVTEYVIALFGGILFCIAIGFLIHFSTGVKELSEVAEELTEDSYAYVSYTVNEQVVTADALYSMLMSGNLSVPIEIDGTVYSNDNLATLDLSNVHLSGTYHYAPIYGADGKLVKLAYARK